MLLAAVLRLWHLGGAGFGTEYYAAAVRGMVADPRNVLFGAFADLLRARIEIEAPWTEIAAVARQLLDRSFMGKAVLHLG